MAQLTPAEVAQQVFADNHSSISAYVDILASRGIDWGLMGPREGGRLWDRHVLNSAALGPLVPKSASVADVGSGAGLPGIPLAILRPDLKITLIESLARRAQFLKLAIAELGLDDRVAVAHERAEQHSQQYDVVTARAVAPLSRLLGWTLPLLKPGGQIIALKGSSAADELAASSAELKRNALLGEVLEVSAHPQAQSTHVIRVRRFT